MMTKLTRITVLATAAMAATIIFPAYAGVGAAGTFTGSSDRELIRRQEGLLIAREHITQGDIAMREKRYKDAYVSYMDALNNLPDGEPIRPDIAKKFNAASLAFAKELAHSGRFPEAEKVAKTNLMPQYSPENREMVKFLSRLEQPDDFNKTITPEQGVEVQEVVRLLAQAQSFFDLGRFDLATKRYEQVLLIDPYNNAARKGMEVVESERTKYYSNARNETRSRMLWLADNTWVRPVNKRMNVRTTDSRVVETNARGNEATVAKLNSIIIPKINFSDTTVREAVQFLQQRSRDLDTSSDDPSQKRGVNIVLKLNTRTSAPAAPASPGTPDLGAATTSGTADTRVSLALSNVPLIEALKYLTELANLKFKVEPYAVAIVPSTENTSDLFTKEYRVPPSFIPQASASDLTGGGVSSSTIGDVTGTRVNARQDARTYLINQGIEFPEGAFAQYVAAGSKLIVKNTADAIDLIDYLVDASMTSQPTQVEIESKFLEITQNNLEELGFDWMLGPLAIGKRYSMSGGTQGYGQPVNYNSYPQGTTGWNPITGGVRSGMGTGPNAAVTANSVDALLAGITQGAAASAPGIFGLSGVFSNLEFQMVMRAISQKKGVDLMSAPKVTTKSGKKAVIRVVREFPYPTQFNPPTVPQTTNNNNNNSGGGSVQSVVSTAGSVTPSTPTAFETRNVGVTLEVEPTVGPDNYTIDLNLSPEVVEFDGFINYGSPINAPAFNPLAVIIDPDTGLPLTSGISIFEITPNVINQPIFSIRKITTNVSVWDGQTISLGGLIREDIQKTQDKVPILGDIPIAGRLFRGDIDQKIKRNLIVFVTARLIDAEGRPMRQDLDEEEEVPSLFNDEPLAIPMPNLK